MSRLERRPTRNRGDTGQILVIFALSAVALIAMVGLVVDGGSTFAQRRSQQNAADLAALAAADTLLLTDDQALATSTALDSAADNGFPNGINGVSVNVSYDLSQGARISVAITAPHENAFTPAIGVRSWDVSTSATALTGFPDTADGAAPFIGSIHVFDNDGNPAPQYADPGHPYSFGDGNGDVPNDAGDFAWTNYGNGNVSTSEVSAIIQGTTVVNLTVAFGDDFRPYIGQHNQGNHTSLFDDVDAYLSGKSLPVPIVDDNGYFQGWSVFHVVGADKHDKSISGYFESSFESTIVGMSVCHWGMCPRYLGSYVLRLVD
jgi:Flp pilus assembly protein TadG